MLKIGLLVVAAIAFIVAAWANWQVIRMAREAGRVLNPDRMLSKREAAAYPEYPLMMAAGSVCVLCVLAAIAFNALD